MIKRDKFKRLLAVAFWLCAIVLALGRLGHAGTAYYVDPGAASGGTGTYASPWNSIAQVNAKAFSAGDDVYFKAGTTLTMTAHLLIDWHGTESDPVVIGAYYGNGLFGLNGGDQPILIGSKTTPVPSSEYVGLINYVGTGYITVQDVHVKNSYGIGIQLMQNYFSDGRRSVYNVVRNCIAEDNGRQGVLLARTSYSIVEDCFIDGSSQVPVVTANGVRYAGAGIEVTGMNRETSVYNVVRGNTVRRAGESIGNYLGARYTTIENNIVYDIARAGIYAANSRDGIIRNNIVYMSDGVSTPNPLPDWGRRPLIWVDCEGHIDSMIMVNGGWQIYGNYVAGGSHGIWLQSNGDEYGVYQVNTKVYDNRIVDCDANIYISTDVTGWTGNEIYDNYSFIFTSGLQHVYGESPVGVTWADNHYNTTIDGVSGNAATSAVYDDPDLIKTTGWRALPDDGTFDAAWWKFYLEVYPYNSAPVISNVTPGSITINNDDLTQVFSSVVTDPDSDEVTIVWDFTTSGAYASNSAVAAPGSLVLIDPATYPTTYTITITATDEHGLSNSYSFNIEILDAEDETPETCQESYAPDLTADINAAVGRYNTVLEGFKYKPATDVEICTMYVYHRTKGGTPTNDVFIKALTLDESDNATALLGNSSVIADTSISNSSWVGPFVFNPPISVASGVTIGFGMACDNDSSLDDVPEYSGTNYYFFGRDNDSNVDGIQTGVRSWLNTGSLPYAPGTTNDAADDMVVKIYTQQAQSESVIVNRVYAVTPNGTYNEGDSIQLAIEFNLPVALTDANSNSTKNFTGTATVGGQTFTATHSFPAFATEATTHYLTGTVPASSSGLLETITLNLNGDAMGTADLTIGAGKNVGSNSEIYFDTSAPAIASFYACDEDGVQITDTTLISTVTSGYVCMESDGDSIFFADGPLGNLTLSLANIVPAVTAHYLSGIGTSKLIFQWDSVAGNRGTDAAVAGTDAFDPTPTVLRDQAGNALTLTLPNTWLIDANELNFAVPKSLIYGAGWWVASDWDTEKPDPVVAGDYFVLGAGALDATETISESGITLNVVGNTTSTVTISGDNNEIWYRQGSALTITDNGTGNVVVRNCPECE